MKKILTTIVLSSFTLAAAAEVSLGIGWPSSQVSFQYNDARVGVSYVSSREEGGLGVEAAYLKSFPVQTLTKAQPYLGAGVGGLFLVNTSSDVVLIYPSVYPHAIAGLKIPVSRHLNLFGEAHAGLLTDFHERVEPRAGARIGLGYLF